MIDVALEPILAGLDAWIRNVQQSVDSVFEKHSPSLVATDPLLAGLLVSKAIVGGPFATLVNLANVISIVWTIISALLNVLGFLLSLVISMLIPLIFKALVGDMMGSSTDANQDPEKELVSNPIQDRIREILENFTFADYTGEHVNFLSGVILAYIAPVATFLGVAGLRAASLSFGVATAGMVTSTFGVVFAAAALTPGLSVNQKTNYKLLAGTLSVLGLILSLGSLALPGSKLMSAIALGATAIGIGICFLS